MSLSETPEGVRNVSGVCAVVSERYEEIILRAGQNFTARWGCRKGDYVLWFRRNPFSAVAEKPQVIDLWSTPDEATVTITNRWQDFPGWFDLHPTETANELVTWMKKRIETGDYLDQPIDGPNIWRVKGGDRVVWVGPPRPDQASVDGVFGILDCEVAVVVLGNHPDGPFAFMSFVTSPIAMQLAAAGLRAERSLGQPRVFDTEWTLG
jgi:hypothetical protein